MQNWGRQVPAPGHPGLGQPWASPSVPVCLPAQGFSLSAGLSLLVAGPCRKPPRVGADSCSVDTRRGGRRQQGAQGWAGSLVWVCTWVCDCVRVRTCLCARVYWGGGSAVFLYPQPPLGPLGPLCLCSWCSEDMGTPL